MGHYDVGFNNPAASSPNIDALMRSGILLNRHYSSRMCAPSRAMLLTGRPAWTVGLNPDFNLNPVVTARCGLAASTPLLPSLLKQVGYKTHALGKWHLGGYSRAFFPTSRGFDSFVGYVRPLQLTGLTRGSSPGTLTTCLRRSTATTAALAKAPASSSAPTLTPSRAPFARTCRP